MSEFGLSTLSTNWCVTSTEALTGSKIAYLFTDNVLLVSPALHSLMQTEDLQKLLVNVRVKKLPFPAQQGLPTLGVTQELP